MSTRELSKGKPILRFFAPTSTDTAAFCQPAERAFHDPTAGWIFLINRDRLRQRFASTSTVTDVALVIGLKNHMEVQPKILTCLDDNKVKIIATWNSGGNLACKSYLSVN